MNDIIKKILKNGSSLNQSINWQILLTLSLFVIICVGSVYSIIRFHLPISLLLLVCIPILLTAYYFPRWMSYCMILLLTGTAFWIAFSSSIDIATSLISISVALILVGFMIAMIQIIQAKHKLTIQRSRILSEYTSDFDFWRKPGGYFEYISPMCEQVTGYLTEEFRQNPRLFFDIIHPDDRNKLRKLWQRPKGVIEFRIRRRDGEEHWIEQTFRRITSKSGVNLGIRAINRDITDQKRNRANLIKIKERLTLALEGTEDGVWDVDLTNGNTYISPNYARTLGLNEQNEIKLQDLHSLIHPEDVDKMLVAFKTHLQGETSVYHAEYRIRTKEGDCHWVLDRGKVFGRSPKGKPIRMIGMHVDITERKKVEEALQQSEEKFRQLAENMREVFWLRDRETGQFIYVSPAYNEVWGRDPESLYQKPNSLVESIHWNDYRRIFPAQKELYKAGNIFNEEYRIIHPDGSIRWVWVREYPIFDTNHKYYRTGGVAEDITERKLAEAALRESEKRYRDLIEHQGGGVSIIDSDEHIVYVNPAGEDIFGVQRGTLVGRSLGEFLDEEQFSFLKKQSSIRRQGVESSFEITVNRPDDKKRNLLVTSTPRFDASGQFLGTIVIFRDITQRKVNEDKLRYISLHDALTNLHNRAYFENKINRLEQSTDSFPVSVIMIDVNELKNANDEYGHSTGDEMLVRVAKVLKTSIRADDTVARIGGDEFAILMPNTDDNILERALERITENLKTENLGSSHLLNISFAMGGYTCREQNGLRDAITQADACMYENKKRNKQQQYYFMTNKKRNE